MSTSIFQTDPESFYEEMRESAIKAAASFRPKKILTEHDAIEIFRMKNAHRFLTNHAASCYLSKKYKVSPKTIRDVWSGRTWRNTTLKKSEANNLACQETTEPTNAMRCLLSKKLNSESPGQLYSVSTPAVNAAYQRNSTDAFPSLKYAPWGDVDVAKMQPPFCPPPAIPFSRAVFETPFAPQCGPIDPFDFPPAPSPLLLPFLHRATATHPSAERAALGFWRAAASPHPPCSCRGACAPIVPGQPGPDPALAWLRVAALAAGLGQAAPAIAPWRNACGWPPPLLGVVSAPGRHYAPPGGAPPPSAWGRLGPAHPPAAPGLGAPAGRLVGAAARWPAVRLR